MVDYEFYFEFKFHREDGHSWIVGGGHGVIKVPPKKLIFDPSVLYYLTICEIEDNDYQIYIPDSLSKLISLSKNNNEYRAFLGRFLQYFSYRRNSKLADYDWDKFYNNIEKIHITPITIEDIEKEEYESILSMFKKHTFYISMSPKMNFLGDVLAKIIIFSKKTGIAILSKTRRLSNLIRRKIATLELPKKFDEAVLRKKEITDQLFRFPGGKATRFFIGVILTVEGFIHPSYPFIGALDMLFVFMDP